jgi:FKBP-type peptidyl-prolyl cis-trans isomerase
MKYLIIISTLTLLWGGIDAIAVMAEGEKLAMRDPATTGQCETPTKEGDIVTFKSKGSLEDGTVFDIGEYEIKIGSSGEAPEGIDQGVRGLCVGDKRVLTIPAELAYGEEGLDTRVPSGAKVLYDVEVVVVERTEQQRRGLLMNKVLDFHDTNKVEDCRMTVKGGDMITWNYVGTFANGGGFATGFFHAKIDNGEVIPGVNEAMKGLCVDGKREMVMHHSQAYGPRGDGKNIPGYANIIFNVHLLSLEREGHGMESVEIKRRHGGVTPENPIKMTDLQEKTGDCDVKVANGSVIIWKGMGYTLDGKIFDKYEQQLEVGDGTTIPALENAILGLCANDGRSVMIHPNEAFGAEGIPGRVPFDATIIFDFHVLKIQKTEL